MTEYVTVHLEAFGEGTGERMVREEKRWGQKKEWKEKRKHKGKEKFA